MKFFNIILIASLLLTFTSCKDKITQDGEDGVVIQPPVTPSPNDQVSDIQFKGIDSVTDIAQKSFIVNWTPVTGAGSYQIFFITKNGLKLQHTVNHPKKSYKLKNLTADTEYRVVVRLMDLEGRIDINDQELKVKTNSWPDYNNEYSIEFNGGNGILLGKASQMLGNKNFTVSTWIKTNQVNDGRYIFSFHKDFSALIGFAFYANDDQLGIEYRDEKDESKKLTTTFNYSDDQWHHMAVTYNRNWLVLYIDGKRVKRVKAKLFALGDRPAAIGLNSFGNGFNGKIDEASIWKVALGGKGVEEIYNNGSSFDLKQHKSANVLKHWYRLGDHSDDNINNTTDHVGKINGKPSLLRSSDFVKDAP